MKLPLSWLSKPHWWFVNIDSRNGLVLILTKVCDFIRLQLVSNKSTYQHNCLCTKMFPCGLYNPRYHINIHAYATFLTLCKVEPSLATGFPLEKRPAMRNFNFIFLIVNLNLNQYSSAHWFKTPWCSYGVIIVCACLSRRRNMLAFATEMNHYHRDRVVPNVSVKFESPLKSISIEIQQWFYVELQNRSSLFYIEISVPVCLLSVVQGHIVQL